MVSKVRDLGVGQSSVHLPWLVPGDGLERPDVVLLQPVLPSVLGEYDLVVDFGLFAVEGVNPTGHRVWS